MELAVDEIETNNMVVGMGTVEGSPGSSLVLLNLLERWRGPASRRMSALQVRFPGHGTEYVVEIARQMVKSSPISLRSNMRGTSEEQASQTRPAS